MSQLDPDRSYRSARFREGVWLMEGIPLTETARAAAPARAAILATLFTFASGLFALSVAEIEIAIPARLTLLSPPESFAVKVNRRGTVRQIITRAGQMVRQGEPLVVLDSAGDGADGKEQIVARAPVDGIVEHESLPHLGRPVERSDVVARVKPNAVHGIGRVTLPAVSRDLVAPGQMVRVKMEGDSDFEDVAQLYDVDPRLLESVDCPQAQKTFSGWIRFVAPPTTQGHLPLREGTMGMAEVVVGHERVLHAIARALRAFQ